MHFNVSQLMRDFSGTTRSYQVDEEVPAWGENREDLHVHGSVTLLRTDRGIWVEAVLDSMTTATCGRCLEEYDQPIGFAVKEEALPVIDPATGKVAVTETERNEQPVIDERNILDLTETIRQYAALNMPMKPVCEPDCRGLCPTCGTNLNQAACRCETVTRDAKWGALLNLVGAVDETDRQN